MMLTMKPHFQALSTPWLQRRNEGTLWTPLVLVLLAQAPGMIILWNMPQHWDLALILGVTLVLQGLWLIQFASLRRQNHPNAARLVPGHLRVLRESLVGLWLLMMAITALLPGATLAWVVADGMLMLLTALLVRMPWLWILLSFAPVPVGSAVRRGAFHPLQADWAAMGASSHAALGAAAVLILAWLLCQLLQDGGTAHFRSYAYSERVRKSVFSRGTANFRLPPVSGRVGEAITALFQAPFRAWMRHLVLNAQATERSVMARAQLALGAHWTGQLAGCLSFALIAALTGAIAGLGFDLPLWTFRGEPAIGFMIGVLSAAMAPVMALRSSLYLTRREQALLMLLPGMPRGAELNRRLALAQLQRVLLSWGVAMGVVVALSLGTGIFWPAMAYGVGSLPVTLMLWRDWARIPPPSASAQTLPALMMAGVGLFAMFLFKSFDPSPLWLIAALLPIIGAGLWRWRQIGALPQAFPAGRLAK